MIDLDRLLDRLQQTILQADADRERRLRNSEYERQKLAFVRSLGVVGIRKEATS